MTRSDGVRNKVSLFNECSRRVLTRCAGLSTTATPQTDSLDTLLSSPDLAADKPPSPTPPHSTRRRILHSILSFLRSLVSPPTIALLSALVIAVVAPLKALFVADPSTTSTFHPTAPDGNPPLDVIYTAIAFVGAASVPLGLIVLGASLAKMKLPRPIYRLPLASIAWMAIFKLILLPILGTLLVGALVRAGWVREDERVLRFVLIYFSACPTATTQIAYTQIFAGEGGEDNADLLASYLIAQVRTLLISFSHDVVANRNVAVLHIRILLRHVDGSHPQLDFLKYRSYRLERRRSP
jgi:hypothetical protein